MTSKRDYTQYSFDGNTVGKGRLVLLLVKRFVTDHTDARFEDVHSAFPDKLQAASAVQFSQERRVVVRLTEVAESETRRYFMAEPDRVVLRDAVAVVSREWNVGNIEGVLERARELGYAVSVEEK